MQRPLVLASAAAHRAALLERLELPFVAVDHRFEERGEDSRFDPDDPAAHALHLARGKARSVADDHERAWVLAADQIAVVRDNGTHLLHKPGTDERAVEQLMRLAGRTHELITAVVLLDTATGDLDHEIDRQQLSMRAFTRDEAAAYVARHHPVDCAGSYRIEDAGIKLFERIESQDYTGIIGLPLMATCALLRRARALP